MTAIFYRKKNVPSGRGKERGEEIAEERGKKVRCLGKHISLNKKGDTSLENLPWEKEEASLACSQVVGRRGGEKKLS